MGKILTEIAESVERSAESGIMTKTDMLSVYEMLNQMFIQLYTQYPEFEEAKTMIAEKYKFQWQIRDEETEKKTENKILEKAICGFKLENLADEVIARALGITVDKVREVLGQPGNATP